MFEAEYYADDLEQALAWSPVLRPLFYSWHGWDLSEEDRQTMSDWLHADPVHRTVYDEIFSGKWPEGEEHFAYFEDAITLMEGIETLRMTESTTPATSLPELPLAVLSGTLCSAGPSRH
ncbi:FecR/PupR family sigma factor regulator [Chitinophaga pinensis]|uniref:FecR/PupR family sigma factor regulator n=1 Tax=Chitinophaga pinensis TaxID=79329 RepID=A0A5C6LNR6_9BACT|nr:FecR/PupR family sigma factor regulator [Chitinophaga pinensis]TWV92210.1 FecR/PupR family sigma factor regulator [Chitinophaga pinensis]